MKAYTFRLEDDIFESLKYIGLKEKKPIRQILIELVQQRVSKAIQSDEQKTKKQNKQVQELTNRVTIVEVIHSLREDCHR